MNWKGNLFGQGNRANATIGRALQLVIRNVGGGRPQEADQSAFGHAGKFTNCFAEDEDTPWQTLAEERCYSDGQSTVTLFSADGPQGVFDQIARTPDVLVRTLADSLAAVQNTKMVNGSDVVMVIGPEHGRVFDDAGWSKAQTTDALLAAALVEGIDLGMGTDKSTGQPLSDPTSTLKPKFRPGGLQLVRAGGDAGLFSAIIPGWLMKGALGTDPVTKEIIE
jgi:hypothetical protein